MGAPRSKVLIATAVGRLIPIANYEGVNDKL